MPTTPQPINWLAVNGPETPKSAEVLDHPDYRQIATFFLGWVCFYSLLSVLRSPLLAGLLARLGGGTNGRSFLPDPEGQVHNEKVVHNRSQPQGLTPVASGASERHTRESPALAFTLFLSFLLASFALFVSVFTFDSSSGGTLCAFFNAWGFVTGKSVIVLGLLIISLNLRDLGVSKFETSIMWAFLLIATGCVFTTAAIATGVLSVVGPAQNSLCTRRYFIPTAAGAAIIFFFLELYSLVRLYTRLGSLRDASVLRVTTLIVFTLANAVPDTIAINTLMDYVPFSLTACLVIAAFNCRLSPPDVPSHGSERTLTSVQGHYGSQNTIPRSITPASARSLPSKDPTEPGRRSSEAPVPRGAVAPVPDRASQRSIPAPLSFSQPQPSYVAGPLRDEYSAFKSPMPQTAKTNWTNDSPMVGAFRSAALQPQTSHHISLAEHTPMTIRAERVMSSVPVISQGPMQPMVFSPAERIVASQAEFAKQLEAADARRAIITPTGPTARPQRPRVNLGSPGVLLSPPNEQSASSRPKSTGPLSTESAIFGSDILRPSPSKRHKDKTRRHSSWALSYAPTTAMSDGDFSSEQDMMRKSLTTTLASVFGAHHRSRSIDSFADLPTPAFPSPPPVLPPLQPTAPLRLPSRFPSITGGRIASIQPRKGTLPPEIANLAVQPLRIPSRGKTAPLALVKRAPRPLPVSPPVVSPPPVLSPPSRGGSRRGSAFKPVFVHGAISESPEASPARDNWQEVTLR